MTSGTVEPTYREIEQLVHRWRHLLALKGTAQTGLDFSCWPMGTDVPFTPMPEWAMGAESAGEHPSSWCPVVNPALLARYAIEVH